jgi:hypothetical protein
VPALRPSILALAVFAALTVAPAVWAAPPAAPAFRPAWIGEFLKSRLGLSYVELARVARGETVARMVEDRGDREIATLGVVAMPQAPQGWSKDFDLAQRIRRSNPDLVSIGAFGVPPKPEEFAGVELDPKALPLIRKCRPTQCTLNLPVDALVALQRAGDPGVADIGAAANGVFHDLQRQDARRYQEAGDASLPVFSNRTRMVTTADAPALLRVRWPSLTQVAPTIERHFRDCPHPGGACSSDLYYWYREKSWKHEVIGLVQGAFEEEGIGTGHYHALVEKTFYANHYFRSAIAVTGVLEDPAGSYLFYLNRSETDNGGPFNFIERALAWYLIPRRLVHQMTAFRDRIAAPVEHPDVTRP